MARLECPQCSTVVDVAAGATPVCANCGFGSQAALAMATYLQCPHCTTVVAVVPGIPPVCTQCGFGAPEPAPAETGPATRPAEAPPPRSRRALYGAVAVAAVLLLVGGALAAVWVTNPDLLPGGGLLNRAGNVSEAEMREAVRAFDSAVNEGAGSALGLEAQLTVPQAPDQVLSGAAVTLRLLQDPEGQAFETYVSISSGGITYAIGMKQEGKVINYALGAEETTQQFYYGRDEDPATLPKISDLRSDEADGVDGLGGLTGDADVVVDSQTATKHKGKPATKFVAHNATAQMEIIVYNKDQRVAWLKIDSPEMSGTIDVLYGDEVKVKVQTSYPKAAFMLDKASPLEFEASEAACSTQCVVSANHTQEVKLEEIEMRAIDLFADGTTSKETAPVVASMRLSEGSKTVAGVTFRFEDVDGDGLVSAGDEYSFDGGNATLQLAFYDGWASAYEGGPQLPGFGVGSLLAAVGVLLGFVGLRRRRSENP